MGKRRESVDAMCIFALSCAGIECKKVAARVGRPDHRVPPVGIGTSTARPWCLGATASCYNAIKLLFHELRHNSNDSNSLMLLKPRKRITPQMDIVRRRYLTVSSSLIIDCNHIRKGSR